MRCICFLLRPIITVSCTRVKPHQHVASFPHTFYVGRGRGNMYHNFMRAKVSTACVCVCTWASLTHQYTWWGVANEMYRKRVCLFVGWFGTGLFISQPGCERREGDGEREDEGVWGGTRLVRQQVGNPGQWLHGSKGWSRAAECMCVFEKQTFYIILLINIFGDQMRVESTSLSAWWNGAMKELQKTPIKRICTIATSSCGNSSGGSFCLTPKSAKLCAFPPPCSIHHAHLNTASKKSHMTRRLGYTLTLTNRHTPDIWHGYDANWTTTNLEWSVGVAGTVPTPLTLAVDRSIHSDRILRNLSHVWLMSVATSCMLYSDKKD